jgi:LPS-assembly lipoprotein
MDRRVWPSDDNYLSMRTRRQWLSAVLLLGLAACGFQPLYGQRGVSGGSAADELAAIRIAPIADRTGQMLYNELRDRLNPSGKPADPRYTLSVSVSETVAELAFRGDETATRANLTLLASYVLQRTVSESSSGNDEVVTSGRARITTGYDILESQFATVVSVEDARARSVKALSEDIQARLAVALSAATASAQ